MSGDGRKVIRPDLEGKNWLTRQIAYVVHQHRQGVMWYQRTRRVEPPFRLYLGKRGRGKSLMLTRDAQLELAAGSVVVSNYLIYDPWSQRSCIVCDSFQDIMTTCLIEVRKNLERPEDQRRRIILVVEEAQEVFNARKWQDLPLWFMSFMQASRHYHVGIFAATQSFGSVDKSFRLLCDEITRTRPALPGLQHRLPVFRLVELGENPDSTDEEGKELGAASLVWVTSRAFSGYTTGDLPLAGSVASLTESEQIEAEIRRIRGLLSEEARSAFDYEDEAA